MAKHTKYLTFAVRIVSSSCTKGFPLRTNAPSTPYERVNLSYERVKPPCEQGADQKWGRPGYPPSGKKLFPWLTEYRKMIYNYKRKMNVEKIVDEFKREIRKVYGDRLAQVILYGSWARGSASGDSDIDLMVVLRGQIHSGREIDRMIDTITDLNLKYDTLISVVPVSEVTYAHTNSPLLLNVRREGIPA